MYRFTILIVAVALAAALPAAAQSSRTSSGDAARSFDAGNAQRLYYRSQTYDGPVRVIEAAPLVGNASSTYTAKQTASRPASRSAVSPAQPRIFAPNSAGHDQVRVIRSTHDVHSRHIAFGDHGNTHDVNPKPVPRGGVTIVDHRVGGGAHLASSRHIVHSRPVHSSAGYHGGHSLNTVWGRGYYPLGVYSHRTVFEQPRVYGGYSNYSNCYPSYGYSNYQPYYGSYNYRPSYGYGCYPRPTYCYPSYGSRVNFGYHGSRFFGGFSIRF